MVVMICFFFFFLVLQLLLARPHHTSVLLSHQPNIIPNCLMMIYNPKQQTLVYLRHSMVVGIQQYETVLLVILTMAIIEKRNNHRQYCSRPISFFFLLVSYTVSIALYLSFFCYLILRVCVCVISFFFLSYICVLIFPNVNIALLRVGAARFSLSLSILHFISSLPLLDIQSLNNKKHRNDYIPLFITKILSRPLKSFLYTYYIYIYIYTALMLSVFGVCLLVLCVSFFLYFLSLQT